MKRAVTFLAVLLMIGVLAGCRPANSPSKFGVNLAPADARAAAAMQDAGFKWVRLFMFWGHFQPNARNQFDFETVNHYDNLLSDLARRGFSVTVVFHVMPHWAMRTTKQKCNWDPVPVGPPADKAYFQEFTNWAATRYKDRVAAWEVWNEPDGGNCSFGGTRHEFRDLMLAPAYDGIKAADPGAIVLGPGMGDVNVSPTELPGMWDDYLTYAADGKQRLIRPINGLAVHGYGRVNRITNKMDSAKKYHRCDANGRCLGPYWLTEFGFDEPGECSTWFGCEPASPGPGQDTRAVFEACRASAECAHAFVWSSHFDDQRVGIDNARFALLDPGTLAPRTKYNEIRDYVRSKEQPLPSRPAAPPPSCGTPTYAHALLPGECLRVGSSLYSPNRQYQLAMQTDGNLVLYGPGGVVWHSNTSGIPAYAVVLQSDGNLVIYGPSGATWSSGTYRFGPATSTTVQDDGAVAIWTSSGGVWARGNYRVG